MKLRCTPNSIRIRIRKTAMGVLENQGKVLETVLFPNGQKLIYGLEVVESSDQLEAHFQDGVLMLHLPKEMADNWMQSDLVGLERDQPLPNNETLHILLEKDFPCKHKEPEENADTFN